MTLHAVIPAQARASIVEEGREHWIPAYVGMTAPERLLKAESSH
jgi:hypothetical protein